MLRNQAGFIASKAAALSAAQATAGAAMAAGRAGASQAYTMFGSAVPGLEDTTRSFQLGKGLRSLITTR